MDKKSKIIDKKKPSQEAHETDASDAGFTAQELAVTDRRRRTIINIVYWILVLALVYVVFKYLIGYLAPFVIGFVISLILRPLIRWINRLIKLKPNITAVIVVALFYSTVGVLVIVGAISLITYLISWIPEISTLYYTMEPELRAWVDSVNDGIKLLDPNITQAIEGIFATLVDSLGRMVGELTDGTVNGLRSILTSVPGFFINMLFMIISTFFISADYGKITGFIMRQLPERPAKLVRHVKQYLGEVILQFIRSYSIIMFVTFSELVIGFLILGVDNLFVIALLSALFDILPVVGVGAVLIPWAIISLIGNNVGLGVGLLIMYLFITVVRNIIEPKIVGDNVGLHPLITLISMFAGAKLFGIIGLFGLPITIALLKSLNDKGAIKLYKKE